MNQKSLLHRRGLNRIRIGGGGPRKKSSRRLMTINSTKLMMAFLAFSFGLFVMILSVLSYVDDNFDTRTAPDSPNQFLIRIGSGLIFPKEDSSSNAEKKKNGYYDYNDNHGENGSSSDNTTTDEAISSLQSPSSPSMPSPSSFLTMYGQHKVSNSLSSLPKWMQEYVKWNQQARAMAMAMAKLSDNSDSTDNNPRTTKATKTKYLVLMCLPHDVCGGLSDRFRPLPFHIFVAAHTSRVLCIYWTAPYALEEFLQPPQGGLDWRCPPELVAAVDVTKPTKRQERQLGMHHRWFRCHGTPERQCTKEGIENIRNSDDVFVTVSFNSNSIDNINKVNMIVHQHSYVGTMPELSQWSHSELMGDIFRIMFQPVEPLAERINATMTSLGIVENQYVSVHVRARYPVPDIVNLSKHKTTDKDGPKFGDMDTVDKGKLEFEGVTKDYLVKIIENAIQCGHNLSPNLPIYFASDHHKVTEYVLSNEFPAEAAASAVTDEGGGKSMPMLIQPLGLQSDEMPLHTDVKHIKETSVEDFYNIFEDLLIMGGSKCVAYGVGSFGSFGAGLTGNRCRAVHRKSAGTPVTCPNIRGDRIPVPINASTLFFDEGTIIFDNYLK